MGNPRTLVGKKKDAGFALLERVRERITAGYIGLIWMRQSACRMMASEKAAAVFAAYRAGWLLAVRAELKLTQRPRRQPVLLFTCAARFATLAEPCEFHCRARRAYFGIAGVLLGPHRTSALISLWT